MNLSKLALTAIASVLIGQTQSFAQRNRDDDNYAGQSFAQIQGSQQDDQSRREEREAQSTIATAAQKAREERDAREEADRHAKEVSDAFEDARDRKEAAKAAKAAQAADAARAEEAARAADAAARAEAIARDKARLLEERRRQADLKRAEAQQARRNAEKAVRDFENQLNRADLNRVADDMRRMSPQQRARQIGAFDFLAHSFKDAGFEVPQRLSELHQLNVSVQVNSPRISPEEEQDNRNSTIITLTALAIASDYASRGVKNKLNTDASRGGVWSDCSAFVEFVLRSSSYKVPDLSTGNIHTFPDLFQPVSYPMPGDVVVQGGHMGIYVGDYPHPNTGIICPFGLQVGDSGTQPAPFGPNGYFYRNNPVVFYRAKRR